MTGPWRKERTDRLEGRLPEPLPSPLIELGYGFQRDSGNLVFQSPISLFGLRPYTAVTARSNRCPSMFSCSGACAFRVARQLTTHPLAGFAYARQLSVQFAQIQPLTRTAKSTLGMCAG